MGGGAEQPGAEEEAFEAWRLVEARRKAESGKLRRVQGVALMVAQVVRVLGPDRILIRASNGARYIVGVRGELIGSPLLKADARVALDLATLVVMRILPKEVDPNVLKMEMEDPGKISFSQIGGLEKEIRQLREVVELPIFQPDLFTRLGINPPKGVLLYGPPGTGKTLLARAVASQLQVTFLKVVASSIVDKYIGESARTVREMFAYARDHQPCIIFIDEIDAIAGKRFGDGNSSDREIQRTLMELLAQMDGFSALPKVKFIMATNRPDTLDPALLRPGRLDRKIEIPLPSEQARLQILRIHLGSARLADDVELEPLLPLSEGFSAADLRNLVTEAGTLALREEEDSIQQSHLSEAARKIQDAKRIESSLHYSPP